MLKAQTDIIGLYMHELGLSVCVSAYRISWRSCNFFFFPVFLFRSTGLQSFHHRLVKYSFKLRFIICQFIWKKFITTTSGDTVGLCGGVFWTVAASRNHLAWMNPEWALPKFALHIKACMCSFSLSLSHRNTRRTSLLPSPSSSFSHVVVARSNI